VKLSALLLTILLAGCAAPQEQEVMLLLIEQCPGVLNEQPKDKQYDA
jgi:hypothetical protein